MGCWSDLWKNGNVRGKTIEHLRERIEQLEGEKNSLNHEINRFKNRSRDPSIQILYETESVRDSSMQPIEYYKKKCEKQELELRKLKIENGTLEDFAISQCKSDSHLYENQKIYDQENSYASENKKLKENITHMETEIENNKRKNSELEKQLQQMNKKMKIEESVEIYQYRQEEIAMKKEIKDLKDELSNFRRQSEIYKKSTEALQITLEDEEFHKHELLCEKDVKINDLENQIKLYKKQLDDQENDFKAKFAKNEEALKKFQNTVQYLNDELHKEQTNNTKLSSTLSQQIAKNKVLRNSFEQANYENVPHRSSKEFQDNTLQKQSSSISATNNGETNGETSGTHGMRSFTQHYRSSQELVNSKVVQEPNNSDIRKQLALKQDENEILRQDVEIYQTLTVSLRKELEQLKKKLEAEGEADERYKELEEINEANDYFTKKELKEHVEKEMNLLANDYENKLKQKDLTISKLDSALVQLNAEVLIKEQKLNSKMQVEIGLQNALSELEEAHANFHESEKQVMTLKQEILKVQSQNEQLRGQIQALETSKDNAQNSIPKTKGQEIPQDPYVVESLGKIAAIEKEGKRLEERVNAFSGTKKDKEFLDLQELLIRLLIKLDNVESEGHDEIRKERKEVLLYVQNVFEVLKDGATSQR